MPLNLDAPPSLTVDEDPSAQPGRAGPLDADALAAEPRLRGVSGRTARLSGQWTALALASDRDHAGALLRRARERPLAAWDLTAIDRLDHAGGQLLWRTWGRKLPDAVALTDTQRGIFDRIALLDAQPHEPPEEAPRIDPITRFGLAIFGFSAHLRSGITLFGGFVQDLGTVIAHPSRMPWRALSAQIFVMGAQALGITALVAFLIGIVLGYLSAQQLSAFGANAFIVNILGLSIIRELGPVLAAILVAGRSGSAITAQLGVMRLTEELDAMRVMGISHGIRLVLPRVLALAIAMPLLIMWTDAIALMGGMVAARFGLGIDFALFLQNLRHAVPIVNFWIGLGKGVVFGTLIALTACHFGFRIKANSQSLGAGTTSSVVSAITVVIFADAVFAIAFQGIGL
ncbi:ABC transporter permease [Robbsia sp. KACC 23696]|uniref:MlaE family ABC transporter permease n=1 Tax=Robbsia sp. KACC 23696 TaxID=3149231 RepID=UPI00325B6F1E